MARSSLIEAPAQPVLRRSDTPACLGQCCAPALCATRRTATHARLRVSLAVAGAGIAEARASRLCTQFWDALDAAANLWTNRINVTCNGKEGRFFPSAYAASQHAAQRTPFPAQAFPAPRPDAVRYCAICRPSGLVRLNVHRVQVQGASRDRALHHKHGNLVRAVQWDHAAVRTKYAATASL